MIDFREEIEKFKPVLEVDQIEGAISGSGSANEMQDMMDILSQITKLLKSSGRDSY